MSVRPVSSPFFPSFSVEALPTRAAAPSPPAANPYGDVYARAATITSLQQGWTTGADERKIRDIILSTTGAELSTLKRLIDLGGESHDLLNLMTDDVDNDGIRAQIRAHIAANAVPTGQVKVYSDVDDTFYSNLKDTRFPKTTIYPGVRAFYNALDRGPQGNDATGDMLFLTARPGLVENSTLDMLASKGVTEASVLSGALLDSVTFTEAARNKNYANRKVDNFSQHHALFPEYGSVFIGDSGQGDAIAGAAMNQLGAARPKAVYIHNVTSMTPQERAAMTAQGIVVFDSYLDAAIDAYQRGLISRQGLRDVRTAARAELNAMTGLNIGQLALAQATLAVAEAREALV